MTNEDLETLGKDPRVQRYYRDQSADAETWTREELVAALKTQALAADFEATMRKKMRTLLHSTVGLGRDVEKHVLVLRSAIETAGNSLMSATNLTGVELIDARANFRKIAEDLLVDLMATPWTPVDWPDLKEFPLPDNREG